MPEIVLTATSDLTGDQRMQRIAAALSEMGYGVLLLGRVLHDSEPLSNRAYKQKRLKCFFRKGKLFYLEFQLRLFFFLLFQRHDLGWAADLDTVLPHWLLKKLEGKPWVYDAHEYFTEVPELRGRPFTKRVWAFVANLCIPDCCSAVTVGEALAEVLSGRYGRPFYVLRNLPVLNGGKEGGDETPGSLVRKTIPEKPVLLYQGALNEGRGLPELLQAVKALPEVELWLAGRGDLSVALRQMVEEEGLNERVRFFGHLPPERLSDLTKTATLGLDLLDASSLNYYYSLSNKSMDYLRAALPSVEMDFPEYRRLHEQWGVYVLLPDLEVSHIVETIRSLLADERRYAQLSEKAARAALALNWEREQKVLQDVLKNCMTHV